MIRGLAKAIKHVSVFSGETLPSFTKANNGRRIESRENGHESIKVIEETTSLQSKELEEHEVGPLETLELWIP